MDIDELCRKAANAVYDKIPGPGNRIMAYDAIHSVIGPALDECDAEIERLKGFCKMLKGHRDAAYARTRLRSTRIAELESRSLTCCFCNQQCESLEELKAHSGECRAHPLWKDAERMDYLESEWETERELIKVGLAHKIKSLFRRNKPITREAIDSEIADAK